MCKGECLSEKILQAEIRRVIRKVGLKRGMAMNKSQYEKDTFVLYHFGQQLAYEECISIIREVFHEYLEGDEGEI